MRTSQLRNCGAAGPAVTDAGNPELLRDLPPLLPQGFHRAERDRIRRADRAVQIRMTLQQLLHPEISALRRKLADHNRHRIRIEPGLAHCVQGALAPVLSRRDVLFRHTQKSDSVVSPRQHELHQLPHRVVIVVIDAGKARIILPGHHQRHAALPHGIREDRRETGSHQNDAGDLVVLHDIQITERIAFFVVRTAQQCHISALTQLPGNAGSHLADRIGMDFRHDHTDLPDMAGPHSLCHQVRMISGLLDGAPDPAALFLTQ